MIIRSAQIDDTEQIFSLFSCLENAGTIWSKDDLISNLKRSAYLNLVAEKDNKIVGFISGHIILNEAELELIVVDKFFRENAIGSTLLLNLFFYLKNSLVKTLFLEVAEDNIAAINLYNKLGFSQISKRENYYKTKDALIFKLEL